MSNDMHSRIEQRAREIWEREGRPDGRAAEHWRMAEEEIARESGQFEDQDSGPAGPAPLTSVEPAEGARDIGETPAEKPASGRQAGPGVQPAKGASAPLVGGASAPEGPAQFEREAKAKAGTPEPADLGRKDTVGAPVEGGASVSGEVADQAKAVRSTPKAELAEKPGRPAEDKKAAGRSKAPNKKKG